MKTTALLIIDYQNWFFRYDKRKTGLDSAIRHTNELSHLFKKFQLPVIHVLTIHKADKSTWPQNMKKDDTAVLIEGTEDVQEILGLQKNDTDLFFTKIRHSAFIRTNFEEYLIQKNIQNLILTGAFIEGCVGQTAIDAYERDFHVTIAREAVLGIEPKRSEIILDWLQEEFNTTISNNHEIKQALDKVYME